MTRALEVTKMVYRGLLNTDLVAALRRHGVQATGLSGVDADLITAHRRLPLRVVDDAGVERTVDYGHVGDIDKVDPRVLETLMNARFVPGGLVAGGRRRGQRLQRQRRHRGGIAGDRAQGAEADLHDRCAGRAARPERSRRRW